MDPDVDLPSISALRDEESPPPADPPSTAKFRIKLPKRQHADAPPSGGDLEGGLAPSADPLAEEDELEEDQLIDDDELAPDASQSANAAPAPSPKKGAHRKPRASKKNGKLSQDPVFMVSTFEVGPTQSAQILQTTEDSWIPVQVQPFVAPSIPGQGKPKRKTAVKREKPVPKAKKTG